MGGVVDTIFGGGKGAGYGDLMSQIQQGMNARRQGEGSAEQALNPFYKDGQPLGLKQYQGEINKQLNPTDFMQQILSHYQQSPFAKNQIETGRQTLEQSAASGGMLNSGDLAKHIAEYGQKISSADMQDYLHNALGIYNTGFGGLGNLQQQGFGAANQIGNWRNQLGNNLAQDYGTYGQAQMGQTQANAGGLDSLLKAGLGGLRGGMSGGLGSAITGILSFL